MSDYAIIKVSLSPVECERLMAGKVIRKRDDGMTVFIFPELVSTRQRVLNLVYSWYVRLVQQITGWR